MDMGTVPLISTFLIYIILGGVYTIGQLITVEVGRYEIWSYRHRLLVGAAFYLASFAPAIILALFLNWNLHLLPWILIGIWSLEKIALNRLNKVMTNKFQPSDKELQQKYGEAFKVDHSEINSILEDEFTRKLGFSVGVESTQESFSFLKGEDVEDEEGLNEAIEGFIEKERKRKSGGNLQ